MDPTHIQIGTCAIGLDEHPFIVAEMSGNHNGSLERAMAIAEAAAAAGASALKLQTYTAASMTLDINRDEFVVTDVASQWHGKTLHALYSEACTPHEWHKAIFDRCSELGILAFSTPFDPGAVAFLDSLGVPCYKIASFEITDLDLISAAAATGKPVIISTGLATVSEISEAVDTARGAGCRDLVLLKCTSSYPADPRDSNLLTMPHMRQLFSCEVGLSDHTLGIGAAVASVALGATVIEKHLTMSRSDGGVDAAFSLEPPEFASLVTEANRAHDALGRVRYAPTESEERSKIFRRSLYIVEDLQAGDELTEQNVRAIRPGFGLPPKFRDMVIGRRLARPAPKGTALAWDLIE